jgi:hypothetical protein
VATVRLPETAVSRRQHTYVRLVRAVYPRRSFAAFEGPLFRPGSVIEVAQLWPEADYPRVPLVIEYAGNDATGRGHRRSNDIYVLWRYEIARNAFTEVLRCVSQGADWLAHMRPAVIAELGRTETRDAKAAANLSGRVLALLDAELELLSDDERAVAMLFVYEQLAARAAHGSNRQH